jgi:hypothetical protein
MSAPSCVLHLMKRPCASALDAVRSSEVWLAVAESLVIGMTIAVCTLARLTDRVQAFHGTENPNLGSRAGSTLSQFE